MDTSMPTQTPTTGPGAVHTSLVEVYYDDRSGRHAFRLPPGSLTKGQIIQAAAGQKISIDPTYELDYTYPDGAHGTVCNDPLPIVAGMVFTSIAHIGL